MSSSDDDLSSDHGELSKARKILSWRPGSRPHRLPTKGGVKFFGCTGTSFEACKVDGQLKQYDELLRSLKVRKASKLGRAEWMGQHGLAKITKQGKFIQTMGHHASEYFALYPEEALFLLDIGDIELTLNDVPMSLQEAFSVILNNSNNKCSLDDYATFSNLVKRGYIVQKYGSTRSKPRSRKHRHSSGGSYSYLAKYPKLEDLRRRKMNKIPRDLLISREWFSKNLEITTQKEQDVEEVDVEQFVVNFPNIADRANNLLSAPPTPLLPVGIPSCSYKIEDIWYQRIKRDTEKQRIYLHQLQKPSCCHLKCTSWSEYKAHKLQAQKQEKDKVKEQRCKVDTWDVKPLLLPGTSSVAERLQKIRTVGRTSSTETKRSPNCFELKYNVFETGPVPFKKTNPGPASFIVVVTNVTTSPPTLYDILCLFKKAKGIPVRFSVIDNGQPSFFEFETANIPDI